MIQSSIFIPVRKSYSLGGAKNKMQNKVGLHKGHIMAVSVYWPDIRRD